MSENEQNDSYKDVCTLTAYAADSQPDSSVQFTLSEAERGYNDKNSERKGVK